MATINTSRPAAPRPLVLATAGTLTALAIVAGVGARQTTHQVTAPRSHPAPDAAPASADQPVRAAAADQALTVYVVGSEEQADLVRVGMDDANNIRHSLGEPPLRYAVIVVGPETAAGVLAALWDDGRIPLGDGLSLQVADLRAR